MKTKSIRQFVKENRTTISEYCDLQKHVKVTNDKDREEWVRNDEGLYNWARSEGVNV